jgi:hypothetical protein
MATAQTLKIDTNQHSTADRVMLSTPIQPSAYKTRDSEAPISIDEACNLIDESCSSLITFSTNVAGIAKPIQEFQVLAVQLGEVKVPALI